MDPNGRIPPRHAITDGSMNQRLLGIGRGTALIRQGGVDPPDIFRPKMVPIKLRGRITNKIMQTIAI